MIVIGVGGGWLWELLEGIEDGGDGAEAVGAGDFEVVGGGGGGVRVGQGEAGAAGGGI